MKQNDRIIFTLLAVSWLLCTCQSTTYTTNQSDITSINRSNADRHVKVDVQTVRRGTFTLQLATTGLIRASAQSRLSFRISGTINQIATHNGSPVEVGQILARLDDRDQSLALRVALDQVNEAKVQLRTLIAEYGGTEMDTVRLQPNTRTFVLTKSGYYKAQTALVQAQQQLDYTILRAPYKGVVANLTPKPFNFITSYEPFCTLISRSELLVEFSVLESELAAVRVAQSVLIRPIAKPNQSYTGHILEINPIVNGQGLVLIKARINQANSGLFEGMNARIIIEKKLSDMIVIPKSAVVERNGRKVAFTVMGGLAKWRYISIAHENELEVAIDKGLQTGDQVITSGNLNLAHDAPVSVAKL